MIIIHHFFSRLTAILVQSAFVIRSKSWRLEFTPYESESERPGESWLRHTEPISEVIWSENESRLHYSQPKMYTNVKVKQQQKKSNQIVLNLI